MEQSVSRTKCKKQFVGRRAIHGNQVLDVKVGQYARTTTGERVDTSKNTGFGTMKNVGHERRVVSYYHDKEGLSPPFDEGPQHQPTYVYLT